MGNSTSCPVEVMPEDPEPFLANGNLNFKAHDVGWIVAGFFGLTGSAASFWLIKKHLEFYTKPDQQRYIVRVLFMVPCYAVYSWLSYFWWTEAIYYQLMRDCYEAVVIASFFYLLLNYLGDTEEEQAQVFKNVKFDKWIWPLGRWRYKPSGPYFLVIMKWSIGQYWIFRPGCTLAAVVTQAFGLYCLESWSPKFSHIWTTTFISISVTVAMYAVLQFYVTMKPELAPQKPLMKFFAVKSVVFLTFWQEAALSVLTMAGVIKATTYWSAAEIQVGISSIFSCFEMAIFGFLHIRAFTYLPYRPPSTDPEKRAFLKTSKRRALLDVLDFRDVGRQLGQGSRQFAKKLVGKDIEKKEAEDHHEQVFGKSRLLGLTYGERDKLTMMVEQEEIEHELERAKLAGMTSPNGESRTLFDSSGPKASLTPWANTTTAFSPSIDSPRFLHDQNTYDEYRYQGLSFGDVRIPQSSTGILHPLPSPHLEEGQQRIRFPSPPPREEIGPEPTYRPSSWRHKVFGKRHTHLPVSTQEDRNIQEILQDRTDDIAYDYPQAPSLAFRDRSVPTAGHLPPRMSSYGPFQPRGGLRIPDPLSPSRYPGFDEEEHVDRMYAIHAVAEHITNTPPTTSRGFIASPTSSEQYRPQDRGEARRLSAPTIRSAGSLPPSVHPSIHYASPGSSRRSHGPGSIQSIPSNSSRASHPYNARRQSFPSQPLPSSLLHDTHIRGLGLRMSPAPTSQKFVFEDY